MSKSIIGEQLWAEMTEDRKVEAVRSGRATLKQITEGLLDGSDALRQACRDVLSHADSSLGEISVETGVDDAAAPATVPIELQKERSEGERRSEIAQENPVSGKAKPRFGLPEGFTPRMQRYGRSVLLQDNVYRLPNQREFIPQPPSGTLGKVRHLYALLTPDQYQESKRGSVYLRTDGRIFDYSVDHGDPDREMFDTGYTIRDLERTGKYVSSPCCEKRKVVERQKQAAGAR